MSRKTSSVVIIGAGFAGLSAAVSLAKTGKDVTVLERADSLAYGASISLTNRGPDVLAELGVLEEVMAHGNVGWDRPMYSNFFDEFGQRLPDPTVPVRDNDGLPHFVQIYRPILGRILSDAAERLGVRIRLGTALEELTDAGDHVVAVLSDGENLVADLAVGADGTMSTIREQLFPGRVTPTYSGNMSIRWVKRHPISGQDGFYLNDHGGVIVTHRIPPDMVYVAAGKDIPELRRIDRREGVALLREAMDDFPAPFIQELRSLVSDDDDVVVRPYTYHNLPAPWHHGRVVVIGDAAHTMTAALASGGVVALEDGVVLGQELGAGDDLEDALLRFASRRALRTFVAVDACRQMLELAITYHAPPPYVSRVREMAFKELLTPY